MLGFGAKVMMEMGATMPYSGHAGLGRHFGNMVLWRAIHNRHPFDKSN